VRWVGDFSEPVATILLEIACKCFLFSSADQKVFVADCILFNLEVSDKVCRCAKLF